MFPYLAKGALVDGIRFQTLKINYSGWSGWPHISPSKWKRKAQGLVREIPLWKRRQERPEAWGRLDLPWWAWRMEGATHWCLKIVSRRWDQPTAAREERDLSPMPQRPECCQPHEWAGNTLSRRASRKKHSAGHTVILVQWDPCWLLTSKRIHLCCFQPLNFWLLFTPPIKKIIQET